MHLQFFDEENSAMSWNISCKRKRTVNELQLKLIQNKKHSVII